MSISYVRVVNQQQILNQSILIDKIDRSQGNFTGYAQKPKQKIYVPYINPDTTKIATPRTKGYIDLVPTDEVLLSLNNGTISGLTAKGYVLSSRVLSTTVATPALTSGSHVPTNTTLGGTTFTSISPDITYAILTNLALAVQIIPSSSFTTFTGTSIVIPDGVVTIGTPGAGWKVQLKANNKLSNIRTL
jgi:hypothetical protein